MQAGGRGFKSHLVHHLNPLPSRIFYNMANACSSVDENEARQILKSFLQGQKLAVLATQDELGPRASLIVYIIDDDLRRLYFLTPKSTRKYRSILRQPRVSLLVDDRCGHMGIQDMTSITIMGSCQECMTGEDEEQRRSLLEKVGEESFPDQAMMRVSVESLSVVTTLDDIQNLVL